MIFYAHDGQLLRDHLSGVAQKASDFAAHFGASDNAYVAGLLHDVGKYSQQFQRRLQGDSVRVDHSTAGAQLAVQRYGTVGLTIAYAVAGHHGGIPDGGNVIEEGTLFHRLQKDLPCYEQYEKEIAFPELSCKLSITPQPECAGFSVSFFIRMLYSCLVDADFLDTESFLNAAKHHRREKPTAINLSSLFGKLEDYISELSDKAPQTHVNTIRASVLTDCLGAAEKAPGLFTLTVPTGGGKTLSSLAFGLRHALNHGHSRIIYAIPFTSIIEQNADVFRKVFGTEVVLEHHSNVIRQVETSEDWAQAHELATENWDMPLIVTTNVQFFESMFSNRSSHCRKLHNVAKSIVILDEAQMLPIELLKPCIAGLVELVRNYGVTVVLCSATQPALDGLLPDYAQPCEIVRDPQYLYTALHRVDVEDKGSLSSQDLAENILDHEQALCIVNTRSYAREVYKGITERPGSFHLSAAMCPLHRSIVLSQIKERLSNGKACRVISTQLIEAGVDIDFPVVYRAIAGIDSIAQAAGRCNREGLRDKGQLYVFMPTEKEGMNHVWFKRTASIGASIIETEDDILSTTSVYRYFKELYFFEESRLDEYEIIRHLEENARKLNFPFNTVSRLFKLIGEDTRGIVVPYDAKCEKTIDSLEFAATRDVLRHLQPYTVSVRPWEMMRLEETGAVRVINGVSVLRDMAFYNEEYGLLSAKGNDECWIV